MKALTLSPQNEIICSTHKHITAIDVNSSRYRALTPYWASRWLSAAPKLARGAGWRTVVSARSGETEDDWLADLAAGWAGDYIKVGSITQSERLAKYNRLLVLEAQDAL